MNGASKKEEDLPTSNRFLFNINAEDSIKRSTTLLESILGKTLNRLKTNSYFPKKSQESGAQSLNLPQEGQGERRKGLQTIKVNPKTHVGSPKPTTDTTEVHPQSKTERAGTQKENHRRPAGLKTESLNHSYSKYGAKNDKITEVFDLRVIKVPQADDDSISRDDSEALGNLSKNLKFKPMLDDGPGGRQLPESHESFKNMDYRRSMTENQPAKSPRQGNNRVIGLNKGRMHPGEFSVVANQLQDTEANKQRGLLQAPGNSSFGDLIPRDDAQRDSMQRSDLSMSQISKLSQTKNNTTERTGLPDRDLNRDSVDLYTNSVGGIPSTESRTRVASTSISSSLKPESEQLPKLSSKNKSAIPKLDAIEEKPEPVVSPASSRPGPGQLGNSDMSDRGKESKIHISDCRAQEDTSVKKLQNEPEFGASPLRQPSSTSSHTRREVSAAGKKGILVNKDRMNAPSDLISVPDFSNMSRGLHQTSQPASGKKPVDDRVRFSDKPTVWLVQSYKTHMKGEDGTSCCERCNLI